MSELLATFQGIDRPNCTVRAHYRTSADSDDVVSGTCRLWLVSAGGIRANEESESFQKLPEYLDVSGDDVEQQCANLASQLESILGVTVEVTLDEETNS